jgi:hypothetical protein
MLGGVEQVGGFCKPVIELCFWAKLKPTARLPPKYVALLITNSGMLANRGVASTGG